MNEQVPAEDLVSRLRLHQNKISNAAWMREMCRDAADCIEQLQMPPAKVRELANSDEGADTLALLRALGVQVEGQRKALTDLRASLAREVNARKVLAETNQRLQSDAGKYRWLISQPTTAVAEPIQKMWLGVAVEGRSYPRPDEWDAAIKASMMEKQS
jgi:hypothetical protein